MTELRKSGQQGQFVILGEYADLTWWGNYDALPVKPLQKITATRNLGKPSVVMTSFDRNHGIFKKFQNSAKFTLSTAQFYAYTKMDLKPGATALVKFEDGSPAMAEFSGKDRGLVDLPRRWTMRFKRVGTTFHSKLRLFPCSSRSPGIFRIPTK